MQTPNTFPDLPAGSAFCNTLDPAGRNGVCRPAASGEHMRDAESQVPARPTESALFQDFQGDFSAC